MRWVTPTSATEGTRIAARKATLRTLRGADGNAIDQAYPGVDYDDLMAGVYGNLGLRVLALALPWVR